MKYVEINLENFGGYDVVFPLGEMERKIRVKEAMKFRSEDPEKFENALKLSGRFVKNNIAYFSTDEDCEGPVWDELREAIVDMMCKLQVMSHLEKSLLED